MQQAEEQDRTAKRLSEANQKVADLEAKLSASLEVKPMQQAGEQDRTAMRLSEANQQVADLEAKLSEQSRITEQMSEVQISEDQSAADRMQLDLQQHIVSLEARLKHQQHIADTALAEKTSSLSQVSELRARVEDQEEAMV